MEIRNVLVIAYYFPPMGLSGVQRTLKFVKYLPDYNWNPIVLTHTPTTYYAFDDTLLNEIESKNIQIYRTTSKKKINKSRFITRKFPSYFTQKLGRAILQTIYIPDSKVRWKENAIDLGSKIIKENEISVIYATAPPFTDFLIAKELSKKFEIPFIVDYRDNWVDNPFHFYPTPFHKLKSIELETDILKHTKRAIVISRYNKELLIKRYKLISHNDISIIPHGYDDDDFSDYEKVKPNPNKFTITHSGVFQDDRTPKYFFKAISNLLKSNNSIESKLELRFVGVMRKSHQKLIKKYKLDNFVTCTGYLSHIDSVKNILESDVLWLMQNDNIRTPGKLYEYFGARKPMLVCVPDGFIRSLALESKAAIATDPQDVLQIEKAITTFFKLWEKKILPAPSDEFVTQFNRKNLTSDLARELALALDV